MPGPEADPRSGPAAGPRGERPGGERLTAGRAGGSTPLALAIGTAGAVLFAFLEMPLPWMLGAMTFVTVASIAGAPVRLPHMLRQCMVVFIGTMLGSQFTPELAERVGDWAVSIGGLLLHGAVAMAAVLAYLRRVGRHNPVTAYFSAAPGGLNDMVIVGREMGGDERTIALTQASRILLVALTVPFLFRVFGGYEPPEGMLPSGSGFDMPLRDWLALLACAALGPFAARALRLPAAFLLGPLALSAVVHMAGWSEAAPPSALVAAAQVALGTGVGCRFAGARYAEVLRTLRVSVGSAALLMSSAAGFGLLVSELTGLPWYAVTLAYAPGGLAEMSLIALGIGQDVAFVTTHHLSRIFMVVLLAPLGFRLIRRWFPAG